ncbi:hypothetical protein HY373_02545 [Candidatus Berkelbacteria bacterium]|nr:hypothetical protein [Candidatus Berkelbacteria bacterium]
MTFEYYKVLDFPGHQKRERILPWLRFGIFHPENKSFLLFPLGLVDSGSDISIIDREFAENLGIKVKKGSRGGVVGIGGGSIEVFYHEIGFYLHNGGLEKPIIYTGFAAFTFEKFPTSMPQQTAILGTQGFFNMVDVTFRYPKEIVIVPKGNF